MIVIMAGLPATGKSSLARELAARLNGLVVDKDSVRAALFSAFVDYTREQDDLTMECVYQAVLYMADAKPETPVFLDGRPFALECQWRRALEMVEGRKWRIIETVCSDEVAQQRLEGSAGHLAANRTFALYLSLKARQEPITAPKIVVDTEIPFEECLRQCIAYIAGDTLNGTL